MNGTEYTEEMLAAIASKYDKLSEFRKKEKPAYCAMQRRGLIGKLCAHMSRKKTYTIDELSEVASRYNNVQDFRRENEAVYSAIHKRGLLDKLCGHMKRKLPGNARTDEELATIASKYKVLKDFYENEPSVIESIIKRGLYDKLCGHMERNPNVMTEDQLAAVASKYDDFHEFRTKEPLIYQRMRNRKLIKKLCGHMKRNRRQNLSDEDLAEIASHYDSISSFMKGDMIAYSLVCRRGLRDKLCGHMKRITRRLSDKDLAEIASGYHTRIEFINNDKTAYSIALTRGILDKICAHMEWLSPRENHWTKELCHIEALKYNTKKDFLEGNLRAYAAASSRGWMKDICGHMVPRGNWVKRKVYVFVFSDGYAYVGLTQDVERRKREHTSKGRKLSPVYKHIQDTRASFEFKELTDWLPMDVAAIEEDKYIKQYANEGWKMLNRASAGSLGSSKHPFYTDERLKREIAKYKYYEDFIKGSRNYYKFLLYHRLVEQYCSHMKRRREPKRHWTLELAIAVVPECKTRSELSKKYIQAYRLIKEAGLLDKFFPLGHKRFSEEEKIRIIDNCVHKGSGTL